MGTAAPVPHPPFFGSGRARPTPVTHSPGKIRKGSVGLGSPVGVNTLTDSDPEHVHRVVIHPIGVGWGPTPACGDRGGGARVRTIRVGQSRVPAGSTA